MMHDRQHACCTGSPGGSKPPFADFPPIQPGEAHSGENLDQHRPKPEAGAVQSRLAPQPQPADDRQPVGRAAAAGPTDRAATKG